MFSFSILCGCWFLERENFLGSATPTTWNGWSWVNVVESYSDHSSKIANNLIQVFKLHHFLPQGYKQHGLEDLFELWHTLFFFHGYLVLILSWIMWPTEIFWCQYIYMYQYYQFKNSIHRHDWLTTTGCKCEATSPDLYSLRVDGCILGVDLPSTASSHHDDTDRGRHFWALWTLTQIKAYRHMSEVWNSLQSEVIPSKVPVREISPHVIWAF